MEGNNDMANASTSETQLIGEIGKETEIPVAICGNGECNGIAHKTNSIPPKAYV